MRSSSYYPHVSCVVEVAPETAGVGFDFACRCLAGEGAGRATPPWTIETASGRLLLRPPVVRAWSVHYYPLRAVPGVLRPAGWGSCPVPVQLEVLPWSRSRSELGLISVTRSWFTPTDRSHRAYLRAAREILDVLRRAVEAPPSEWLSRLAWGPETTVPSLERAPAGAGTDGPGS